MTVVAHFEKTLIEVALFQMTLIVVVLVQKTLFVETVLNAVELAGMKVVDELELVEMAQVATLQSGVKPAGAVLVDVTLVDMTSVAQIILAGVG